MTREDDLVAIRAMGEDTATERDHRGKHGLGRTGGGAAMWGIMGGAELRK